VLGGGGASGLGRPIAQLLAAAGEPVLDVPAKLAARARLLSSGSGRKTDLADACSVAAAAIHHRQLRPVALEDQTVVFCLLSDRRDDLVAEGTRILSRLQVLLADLQPGGRPASSRPPSRRPAPPDPSQHRRCDRGKRIAVSCWRRASPGPTGKDGQPGHPPSTPRARHAPDRGLGVGPVLAAKLLGHTGDSTRFPDPDHFASYSGTAPVEAPAATCPAIG